jgi:hypothetical protein
MKGAAGSLTGELASLADLTSLTLWGNNIGADGAREIAASLTGLTSLIGRGTASARARIRCDQQEQ